MLCGRICIESAAYSYSLGFPVIITQLRVTYYGLLIKKITDPSSVYLFVFLFCTDPSPAYKFQHEMKCEISYLYDSLNLI